jgi:Mg2+-importing ATPase
MPRTPLSPIAAAPPAFVPDGLHELALRALATAAPLGVFRRLGSSPSGLTEHEAAERLASADPATRRPSALPPLRTAVASPFVLLLAGLGAVFVLVGDARGWATVSAMVAASVGLRWWQQVRSDRAMHGLRSRTITTVTVRRRATDRGRPVEREIPVDDVVRGDVICLAAGDVVPADMRVLTARQLSIDQAVLSGEQLPVRKDAPTGRTAAAGILDVPSLCFAGTSVVSGTGTAVVIGTGPGTCFGSLAAGAVGERPRSTVEQGVRAVGWTLTRFMLVMVPIVFAVSGTVGGSWTQAALFAVAVAVGLTPEMLPVIVTTTLARGAVNLARHDVVVKRLDAIQDLGGMDVLCLDKTGTLTEDRVVLTHSIDVEGELDDAAAEYAFLAVHLGSGPRGPVDDAVVDYVGEGHALLVEALYERVDEICFDHDRRRSTTVVRRGAEDVVVTWGDPDEVLPLCAVTDDVRGLVRECVAGHEAYGMRIRAVAAWTGPARRHPYGPDDETGLTLIGLVGFVDPVRESTAAAVRELAVHGVTVRVLTGDAPRVAEQVCEQAGIPVQEIVLGHDVDAASDAALARIVRRATVFAKVTPRQKARIVGALRAGGHCVGFLGDGVNDTLALRTADVGICVDGATPAARDAADLVLRGADLAVLAAAVVEGRRTLGNTMKYVKITAASNLGNALSVLVASAVLPFLPMLPVQLMVQNLLYDAAQLALPWDRVERAYVRRPRRWDAGRLTRFMLVFGPLSSLFDLATFAALWWALGVDTAGEQAVFHAAWFTEGLLSQLLVVLVLRGQRLRQPAWPVLAATATAGAVAVALPLSPLAGPLMLAPPPASFAPWLVGILGAYLIVVQLAKVAVVRRTGGWL